MAFLDYKVIDRVNLLTVQNLPRVICVVLHDDDHQALMVVCTDEWVPVIYNGHQPSVCKILGYAVKAMKVICQQYKVDYAKCSKPVAGKVAQQHDEWSCGHKMIGVLSYLLDHGLGLELKDLANLKVPGPTLDTDALAKICSNSNLECDGKLKYEAFVKVERTGTGHEKMKNATPPSKKHSNEPLPDKPQQTDSQKATTSQPKTCSPPSPKKQIEDNDASLKKEKTDFQTESKKASKLQTTSQPNCNTSTPAKQEE